MEMLEFKRTKRQFIADSVVIIVILIGALIFVGISSLTLSGWDIKGKDEVLSGEEKIVNSNVYIRKGGSLSLEDSTLVISSTYSNEFGILLEGDTRLTINGSRIEGDEFQYYISSGADKDGKSPKIDVYDSVITDHSGIYLRNRSRFEAEDSTIEELHLQDAVHAELTNSKVYLVVSNEDEEYEGLEAGEEIDMDMESDSGWDLKMDDCEVWGYQLELIKGNDVKVRNSSDIVYSLHTPGDLEDTVDLDFSYVGDVSSGSITNLGFDLMWESTQIDMINVYVNGSDSITASHGTLNEIDVFDEGALLAEEMEIFCNICDVENFAKVHLRNVTIAVDDDQDPLLIVQDYGEVVIEGSDVRELRIILQGNSTLKLIDSQYNKNKIDNRGSGEVIYEDDSN